MALGALQAIGQQEELFGTDIICCGQSVDASEEACQRHMLAKEHQTSTAI